MNPADWEARLTKTREAARAFAAFFGRWAGEGLAHGEPTTGTLRGGPILDGSFVEVCEEGPDHADRCLYWFDPADEAYRVTHLFAGATVREYVVELTEAGLVWITPPGEPSVEWTFGAEELTCDVVWPHDARPEVHMVWRRAPDAG